MNEDFKKKERKETKKEAGNSLIEVLVALSLFSLICLGTSMLFICSKVLEGKTESQLVIQSQALNKAESDVAKIYNRPVYLSD